jgi:hypothetical protein
MAELDMPPNQIGLPSLRIIKGEAMAGNLPVRP